MDEQNQEENAEDMAQYVVSMHLEANKKISRLAKIIMAIGILLAIYVRDYWPLLVAALLSAAEYFYLLHSCLRLVKRNTGMSIEQQAHLSHRYKTDPQFANEINAYYRKNFSSVRS
jgi:hypothetical protein